MVDNNIKLNILHNNNGTFTDYSNECLDYSRDSATFTVVNPTGFIYIGYKKPFNSVYIDLSTPNLNSNTLDLAYWNGATWSPLSGGLDDTKGLTRSGFITWDRNQFDETAKAVNATTLYWIRLQPGATTTAMTFNGISFLFCDDQDLKSEVPEIVDSNHLAGKTSHILTHIAVRNQLLQDLRNKDYKHKNYTTGLYEDLTVWDILDASQLKQAAIFLALSKIYFNFSDSVDDIYKSKSDKYYSRYENAIKLARISIDEDNDGLTDTFEGMVEFKNIRIKR